MSVMVVCVIVSSWKLSSWRWQARVLSHSLQTWRARYCETSRINVVCPQFLVCLICSSVEVIKY